MLDLNKNIINSEGVIIFNNYYLSYQERSDEYGIDYTILDKKLNEVDGGELAYGDYNEHTEMYDIDNGTETVTLKELLDFINEDSRDYNFNEYGIEIVSEDILDVIQQHI